MCVRSCKQASGRCERGFRESLGKRRVSRGQWLELWGISEAEVLGGRGAESWWAEDWPWDSLGERGPYQAGAGIPKWLWLGFGWLFKNKDTRLTPEEESPPSPWLNIIQKTSTFKKTCLPLGVFSCLFPTSLLLPQHLNSEIRHLNRCSNHSSDMGKRQRRPKGWSYFCHSCSSIPKY